MKFLCFLGIHNWSKDINEICNHYFHTAVAECLRCEKKKILYTDIFSP